eukprot:tig00000093_g3563.t1
MMINLASERGIAADGVSHAELDAAKELEDPEDHDQLQEERKERWRAATRKCRAKKKMLCEHFQVENVQLRQELEELRERVQKANLAAVTSEEYHRAREAIHHNMPYLAAASINNVLSLRKEMHANAIQAISELPVILPSVTKIEVHIWYLLTWMHLKRTGANPTDPLLRAINESDGPLHQNLHPAQSDILIRKIEPNAERLGRLADDIKSLRGMVGDAQAAGATLAEDMAWFNEEFTPAVHAVLSPSQIVAGWRFLEAAAPALSEAVLGYRMQAPPRPAAAPKHAPPAFAYPSNSSVVFIPPPGPAPAPAPFPYPPARSLHGLHPAPAAGPAIGHARGPPPGASRGPACAPGPAHGPPPRPAAAPGSSIGQRAARASAPQARPPSQPAELSQRFPAAAPAAPPPADIATAFLAPLAPPRAPPLAPAPAPGLAAGPAEPRAPAAAPAAPAPLAPVPQIPGLAPALPPRKAPAAAPASVPEPRTMPPIPPSQQPPLAAGPLLEPSVIREMIRAAVAHEMSSFFPASADASPNLLAAPPPLSAPSAGSDVDGSGGSGGDASGGASGSASASASDRELWDEDSPWPPWPWGASLPTSASASNSYPSSS